MKWNEMKSLIRYYQPWRNSHQIKKKFKLLKLLLPPVDTYDKRFCFVLLVSAGVSSAPVDFEEVLKRLSGKNVAPDLPYQWKKKQKKKTVKSEQLLIDDQHFSPTNYFTRLKLTPSKNFYQLFLFLNKNQTTKIFKKNYQIYYTIVWLSGDG